MLIRLLAWCQARGRNLTDVGCVAFCCNCALRHREGTVSFFFSVSSGAKS